MAKSDAAAAASTPVLNEAISGNEVLRDGAGVSALARLDRDVLSLPAVRSIVLLEGTHDINIHGQVTGPDALNPEDVSGGCDCGLPGDNRAGSHAGHSSRWRDTDS